MLLMYDEAHEVIHVTHEPHPPLCPLTQWCLVRMNIHAPGRSRVDSGAWDVGMYPQRLL